MVNMDFLQRLQRLYPKKSKRVRLEYSGFFLLILNLISLWSWNN